MSSFLYFLRWEIAYYLRSKEAYLFTALFHVSALSSCFLFGRLLELGQASMDLYFENLPWILAVYIPALAMRLWSKEFQNRTIYLLVGIPISWLSLTLAKFFAAFLVLLFSLLLTFPIPLSIEYLGSPNWGIIMGGYAGTILYAGSSLAICTLCSVLQRTAASSFVLGVLVNLGLLLISSDNFRDAVSGLIPSQFVPLILGIGTFPHFEALASGIFDSRDIIYFLGITAVALGINIIHLSPRYQT